MHHLNGHMAKAVPEECDQCKVIFCDMDQHKIIHYVFDLAITISKNGDIQKAIKAVYDKATWLDICRLALYI